MKRLLLLFLTVAGLGTLRAQNNVDWANFGRFEEANAALKESPAVVFMGNSITEQWIGTHPEFFSSHNYANRGISGQTSSQMLVRFRADVIDLHPQAVVILAGTNDIARNTGYISLEHIFDNIVSMAELARANGIRPVLCSVLPTRDFPWSPGLEPARKVIELNAMIRAYAEREKIPYVDYHGVMSEPDGGMIAAYTTDGVHATAAGYDVMEQCVQAVLEKMLRKHRR